MLHKTDMNLYYYKRQLKNKALINKFNSLSRPKID